MHPLLARLRDAAAGRPPPPDGSVEVVPNAGIASAIVAFTAFHVIAADVDEDHVRPRLPPGDFGAPLSPAFQLFLAGWVGAEPGALDLVLVHPATGSYGAASAASALTVDPQLPVELVRRDDLADHPRVRRASRYRTDLSVWTDPTGAGVLVIGRGLAGRWEMAFEVDPAARGRGLGRRLAASRADPRRRRRAALRPGLAGQRRVRTGRPRRRVPPHRQRGPLPRLTRWSSTSSRCSSSSARPTRPT